MDSIVVGISGASGAVLGFKTVAGCCKAGLRVDCIMTDAARRIAAEELSLFPTTDEGVLEYFSDDIRHQIRIFPIENIGASIASGTHPTRGMIIAPCSMATLSAIACGLSDTLLRRAADVTIKEGRPLLVVPREMPMSRIHLENMLKLSSLGVVIMPPQPAWYQKPRTIEDVEADIVARILDRFGLPSDLKRWQ